MKYPTIRYEKSETERVLFLHSFDGTYRSVTFASDHHMASALMMGSAQADCTAVEAGMLPRGATTVSRASAHPPLIVLAEMNGEGMNGKTLPSVDPLEAVRLGFSQQLLIDRSEPIDEERDAQARHDRPDDARRYDSLVTSFGGADKSGGVS